MAGEGQAACNYDFSQCEQLGIALIIVNQNFRPTTGYSRRKGAGEDFKNLKETFTKLGFTVEAYFDQTGVQILSHVKRVAEKNHENNGCFAMAISSHGERYEDRQQLRQKDSVVGTDAVPVSFHALTYYFQEENCPSLKGKPKLYFIQCCRGERLCDVATVADDPSEIQPPQEGNGSTDGCDGDGAGSSKQARIKAALMRSKIIYSDDIPLQRHFLLACSIPPDYFAFHNMNGSWFIMELCKVLNEQHGNHDIMRMLSEVNWRVATEYETKTPNRPEFDKRRIMPWVASMLTKDVYI